MGTGKTKEAAIDELNTAVRSLAAYAVQAKIFDMMSLCKQAPERGLWQMFDQAKQATGKLQEHVLDVCPEVKPVKVKQREAAKPPQEPVFTKREFTYCVAVLQAAA